MFASIHVLKHMCQIWGRKATSCTRNWAFMFLYFYMIVQMLLSFIIVGSFFGVFSIFLRAVFPSTSCITVEKPANAIESIYVVFLFLVLLLSTTIEITWAETGYRVCSMFMGIFTLLMVINSVFYILQESLLSFGALFIFILLLSYFLPLMINVTSLRV